MNASTGTPEWMRRALCLGADSDLWFGGDDEKSSTAARHKREAVAHCRECPVSLECDQLATAKREHYGVWGGIDRSAGKVTRARQRDAMNTIWQQRTVTASDTRPLADVIRIDRRRPAADDHHGRRARAAEGWA